MRLFLISSLALCILIAEALTLDCGPDEELNSCPKYGTFDNDCDAVFGGFKKYCPPQPCDYQCVPRCDCKKGFVRNAEKCCIPAEKCCTGQNEEMTNCPADCDNSCLGKPYPGCKIVPCFNKGCRCQKDFVRHNNTCISRKDCPAKVDLPGIYKPLQAINGKKGVNNAKKLAGRAKICVAKNVQGKNSTNSTSPGKPNRPQPNKLGNSPPSTNVPPPKSPPASLKPSTSENSPPSTNVPLPLGPLAPLKPSTPGNSPPLTGVPPLKPLAPVNTPPTYPN